MRDTACCISVTAASMSVPYSNDTWTCAMPSLEVEVISVTPPMPWKLLSIGLVTCSSTISGEAPW
jgi:hypothetical protein